MWQNYDYNDFVSGGFWVYTYGNYSNYAWQYVGNGANDQATSIYNNRAWRTGIDKDYPGTSPDDYCLAGGYSNGNLVENNWADGSGENDSISSFWFSASSTSCGF